MPLYEYACPTCHVRFERLVPFADADRAACPDCGTSARRLLSVIGGLSGGAPDPVSCGAPSCGAGGCGAC